MRKSPAFGLLLALSTLGAAHSTREYLPVVMWHGMGDTYCSENSMAYISELIKQELPGVFVHSIGVGNSEGEDRNAGFFGNLNSQIDAVCKELTEMDELENGANLLGFSQGGLFLRALVQRCPELYAKNLVTFGSPHAGVSKIPECNSPTDYLCKWMRSLASRGVYSWYIKDHVIQAQYFKDPSRIDQYLKNNIFLPDINNELDDKNNTYKERIRNLETMTLISFDNDTMIYPPSSTHFGFVDKDGNQLPFEDTQLYKEDTLGLRELHDSGRLEFIVITGEHMEIDETALRDIVSKRFGFRKTASPAFVVQGQ